jgi:hypothetical protein
MSVLKRKKLQLLVLLLLSNTLDSFKKSWNNRLRGFFLFRPFSKKTALEKCLLKVDGVNLALRSVSLSPVIRVNLFPLKSMAAIRGLTRRTRSHGENQTKVNLMWTEFGSSQDINLNCSDP